MIDDFAAGCSSPFEPLPEETFRTWGALVLASRIEAFLSRWADELGRASEGAIPVLAALAADLKCLASDAEDPAGAEAFLLGWHPLAGLAPLSALDAGLSGPALVRAAQSVLRIAERRAVSARFATEIPWRYVFGRGVLPEARTVAVESFRSRCHIACDDRQITFVREKTGWRCGSAALPRVPAVELGGRNILVHAIPRAIAAHDPKVVEASPAMIEGLEAAIRLLSGSASYRDWVARTLRLVVPLQLIAGQYDSESFASLAGGAFISLHSDAVRTAETLVHETSHDHLHLVMALDPLVDPASDEQFWSPPRRCQRPTLGILKAQHAFANVLCFYYLLRLAGLQLHSSYARGIEQLEAWHVHFAECLSKARGVTPAGSALWSHVTSRVAQLGAIAGRKAA
jgi:HEXXH motif-containing protein